MSALNYLENKNGWFAINLGTNIENPYDLMINDPVYSVIEYDTNGDKSLETVFGRDSLPRKKWLMR